MRRWMGPLVILLLSLSFVIPASTPTRAQMESPPPLDYVPVADPFKLPDGMNFGGVSGVAINSRGHIFVLHRGPSPLMEFDADGVLLVVNEQLRSSHYPCLRTFPRETVG